jgi:transposase
LQKASFDKYCEGRLPEVLSRKLARPSLPPGTYFRAMLMGFFEGIERESGNDVDRAVG